MSVNVSFGRPGVASVVSQAREFAADIVMLQDAGARLEEELKQGFDGWNLRVDGEFVLATRYRFGFRDVFVPPDLVYPQGRGGTHYVHYPLETPLGLVEVFNVHPTSPRPGLEEVRGSGLREEIISSRLLSGKTSGPVEWNAYCATLGGLKPSPSGDGFSGYLVV